MRGLTRILSTNEREHVMRKFLVSIAAALAIAFAPPLYASDLCAIASISAERAQTMRQSGMTFEEIANVVDNEALPAAIAAGVSPLEWEYVIRGFMYALGNAADIKPQDMGRAAFAACTAATV